DALGRSLRPVTYATHDFLGAAQPARELLTVLFNVNLHLRHSTLHGRLGNRGGLRKEHARVERLGNDVVRTEVQAAKSVGAQHHVGDIFLSQSCEGARRRNLHLLVDGSGSDIQGAAEYKGETKNIIDLIGTVG